MNQAFKLIYGLEMLAALYSQSEFYNLHSKLIFINS